MTTEPVIEGLTGHDVEVYHYDRHGVPVDRGMLDAADQAKPDVILYIGQNSGPFRPARDTLAWLRQRALTVLLCFDGSDATWDGLLSDYAEHDTFDLVVNIDGNQNWPSRERDLTLLTPTASRFYDQPRALKDRSITFGFAGGYASESRRAIVEHCKAHAGLVIPPRNETYGTYFRYATFMQSCRVVLNVPLSGSDNAAQVKGRVLEAGWAGCCLLDHEASGAKNWFDPGTDYAVYRDAGDAVAQVKQLLAEPGLAQYLADSLAKRIRAEHSPDVFWSKVFERIAL